MTGSFRVLSEYNNVTVWPFFISLYTNTEEISRYTENVIDEYIQGIHKVWKPRNNSVQGHHRDAREKS